MKSLLDRLSEPRPLLGDGALGTLLQQRGFELDPCPEVINLQHPEALEVIAREYLAAGAELLQTNTFGGSFIRLAMHDLTNDLEEINFAAAAIVKEVAYERAWVTGSCGPCGQQLKPFGDVSSWEVKNSFQRQFEPLVLAGVDAISIETMIDIEEAALAIQAAKSLPQAVVIIASATFQQTPAGFFTPFGSTVSDVLERLTAEGADVIGANCSMGMERMVEIAREMRARTDLPILIRPNAGLPALRDNQPFWLETPKQFAEGARELLALGVNIIGGCCGTTPDHIRELRKTIDQFCAAEQDVPT